MYSTEDLYVTVNISQEAEHQYMAGILQVTKKKSISIIAWERNERCSLKKRLKNCEEQKHAVVCKCNYSYRLHLYINIIISASNFYKLG